MGDLPSLQATDADREFLVRQWGDLTGRFPARAEDRDGLYALAAGRHSAEGRHYHNLRHVAELLRLLSEFEHRLDDYDAARLAAWFHDAVYDTRRGDNEERSAELAGRALHELNAPAGVADSVRQMILATKGHAAEGLPRDAQLFLDADLSILGSAPEVYAQYSMAVRLEYSWAGGAAYRRGRKKVLEDFLSRGRIYHDEEMCRRFEARARSNISREIEQL